MTVAIFALLGIQMFAQTSDTLKNVVVSATRQASISTDLPVSITEQKIQPYALSTPEAISTISGVFMQRTNQGGGSAFIRGLTGNQTLLVLDGIRFNNSTFRYGPNQYLNTIDPFNLDKVEVLKGTGSVQYGSDALTGAIHLFTIQPSFSAQPILSGQHLARWASSGMERSLLNRISYKTAKFSSLLSISYKDFGDIIRGGDNKLQQPTGYNESNILFKFRHKLSSIWEMEGLIQQNEQSNVPVYHKIQLENFAINEMSLQRYRRSYLKAIANINRPLIKSIEMAGSFQQSVENRTLQKNGSQVTRFESDQVQTGGLTVQIKSTLFRNHSSVTGVEFYRDWIQSARRDVQINSVSNLRGLYPNHSIYRSLSAFSLHELKITDWMFHTGIRYQQSTAIIPDTTVGKSNISMGALVYDLGTSFTFNKEHTLFFNFSTGFRAPNMDDLGSLGIVDFRYELPAYHLKPEYAFNKTIGFRKSNKRWISEWVLFHTNLENLINRRKTNEIIQSYPVYIKENVDKAYMYGFEINQAFFLNSFMQVKNQLSYTFGQNVSQNEPMRRIPPLHGNVQFIYKESKWQMGIDWIFAAKQDRLSAGDKSDNRMNPNGTPGWGIINLDVKYQLLQHIQLRMQGINLNNVHYRMHGSGIDGIGRSIFMQLLLEW